jgi:hypothetical protein
LSRASQLCAGGLEGADLRRDLSEALGIVREILHHVQLLREDVERDPVFLSNRLQIINELFRRVDLIFFLSVQQIEQNDGSAVRRTAGEIEEV